MLVCPVWIAHWRDIELHQPPCCVIQSIQSVFNQHLSSTASGRPKALFAYPRLIAFAQGLGLAHQILEEVGFDNFTHLLLPLGFIDLNF
jgi:hypothetical protein